MNVHSSNDRLSLFVRLNILFILAACSNPPTPSASQPVKTPMLPPTTTSTAISSPTVTPNPTEEFLATLQRDFPIDCDWGWGTMLLSPDGKYLACSSSGNIIISSKDKTLRKTIQAESISLELPFPFHGIYLKPERWSTGNEYVYFSVQTDYGGGCGCFCNWNGIAMYRFDITTERIEGVVPFMADDKTTMIVMRFSFSTDMNEIAYVVDGVQLHVKDLYSGKEHSRRFPSFIHQHIWSFDDSQLGIILLNCQEDIPVASRVEILDAKNLLSLTAFNLTAGYYWEILDWSPANIISLIANGDLAPKSFDNPPNKIIIDLNSPNPVPVTPTP